MPVALVVDIPAFSSFWRCCSACTIAKSPPQPPSGCRRFLHSEASPAARRRYEAARYFSRPSWRGNASRRQKYSHGADTPGLMGTPTIL